MRPSITLGLLLGAALSASALGCRDSSPAQPQPTLDNRSPSDDGGDQEDDSSSTTPPTSWPAEPTPGGPDTASAPPPLPASFSVDGVALGAVSGSDTTRTVRLPGVTARLVRVRAADGAVEREVVIGTAVADDDGEFAFENVSSAYYRLDVSAPAGGPYVDASRTIVPPWSGRISVHVVLLRKG